MQPIVNIVVSTDEKEVKMVKKEVGELPFDEVDKGGRLVFGGKCVFGGGKVDGIGESEEVQRRGAEWWDIVAEQK